MDHAKALTDLLQIEHPIIMAPMFLVSDVKMVKAAVDAGITGVIPALNYRSIQDLSDAISELKNYSDKPFGINLIVNKSNVYYKKQLKTCIDLRVPFIITSLGNPKETIQEAKKVGTKVFCDVVNLDYAKKVESLGADAVIAVNSNAGGHAGNLKPEELIPLLASNCKIPVISAGGVGTYREMQDILNLGACGLSVGSPFIATKEAPVSEDYKEACVKFGKNDIVLTDKLSGTPCTVINTPYVKAQNIQSGWFERTIKRNRFLKKWFKMITALKGMNSLRKAAFNVTYKTVWCAGPSIEHSRSVESIASVVKRLTQE